MFVVCREGGGTVDRSFGKPLSRCYMFNFALVQFKFGSIVFVVSVQEGYAIGEPQTPTVGGTCLCTCYAY